MPLWHISSDNSRSQFENDISSNIHNSTNTKEVAEASRPFSTILIDDSEWNIRIQDVGTQDKKNMLKKSYKSKQISPYGPAKMYYFHLNAIAIDYISAFKKESAIYLNLNLKSDEIRIYDMHCTYIRLN